MKDDFTVFMIGSTSSQHHLIPLHPGVDMMLTELKTNKLLVTCLTAVSSADKFNTSYFNICEAEAACKVNNHLDDV